MSDGEPLKILCIEDNPVNWRLVQRLLVQAGYGMVWADEGMKGFELALEIRPNLVLLDLNLPGLSGFEVASKFRQHELLRDVPLVALTSRTLKSDRDTALVAGCDGFIPKPIDPFTFVQQVESYLGGHRDRIEANRESTVLREFNSQVLEHLEIQLREAQRANQKLLETQQVLETRSRSLARLLSLSQNLLTEHDPRSLLMRILEQIRSEVKARSFNAYRLHGSGGFWEGFCWTGVDFEDAPTLPKDHAFLLQAQALPRGSVVHGDPLKVSRAWEEGLALGFWKPGMDCSLLVLKDRQDEQGAWGFWAFAKESAVPFQPLDLELMVLYASIALVGLENAELIENLNESSRALESSFERLESAYQDLTQAKAALSLRDRQTLLGDLFLKISQRLEVPVQMLKAQSRFLDPLVASQSTREQIQQGVLKIDALLKGLMRRANREVPTTPEWIDLHNLLTQEMEFLEAEGVVPPDAAVDLRLRAEAPSIFGVYGDFAKLLQHLVAHAFSGPTPSQWLRVKTWTEGEDFYLDLADDGGPLLPETLTLAFEPFYTLHHADIMGLRGPGPGLPTCRQLLASYGGEITIRNEGEGTAVELHFPLK